tara:strand:+ start:33022 stop:33237 length:216 start_codon:yes stop_codon:yes gene_type:complete
LVVERGEPSLRSLPIDWVVDAIGFLPNVMKILLVELKTLGWRVIVLDQTDNATQSTRLFALDTKETDRQAA